METALDFRDNSRAIAAMTLSSAGFILNDTLVKIAADDLPLGQILLVRGLFCILFMGAACYATGAYRHFSSLRHPTVLIRSLAEALATLFYLTALFRIEIGNATAILQALPLVVTAGAAVFLKAPVGWRRWLAILVGFAGVLLIIRPGLEGFNVWSLSALAGIFCMAVRDLATRQMPEDIPTLGVALAALCLVTLIGAALCIYDGWQPMDGKTYGFLAGAAVLIIVGYVALIVAMRLGEISVVAPFRYSAILWGLLMGYLVWGDVPDLLTLAGITIIVLTGVYTFFREQRLYKQAKG